MNIYMKSIIKIAETDTVKVIAFTFVLIIVRYFLQKNFLQVRDSTTKVHR
jgi:hypothetical protein